MARRGDPGVLRMVVIFLRSQANMTQAQFGREARVGQADVSRYELGHLAPSEATLRRMANVARIDWPLVAHLRQYFSSLLDAAAKHKASPAGLLEEFEVMQPVLLAVGPYLLDIQTSQSVQPPPEIQQFQAEQIWTALERYPLHFRRRLIELSPRSGNWALALQACAASAKKTARDAAEAVELAELALSIAERFSGPDSWRSHLKSYCWAHIANARRTADHLPAAEEAFARAWNLRRTAAAPGPEILSEWVLPSMEASLRRAQGRFQEALRLLEIAKSYCGGSKPQALVYLLLQKEHILEQLGDSEGALKILDEAASFVEDCGDDRKIFAFRFKVVNNLCHLQRFEEAAKLLPQVRELAIEQANTLDLIRVSWLTAKVAAGQGLMDEAISHLEQVYKEFTARELAYDAALSSLDLAVLLLKAKRSTEVRIMAIGMGWIFKAKGLDRNALMALKLFCDAANQDNATVELARQVVTELERVRRGAVECADLS